MNSTMVNYNLTNVIYIYGTFQANLSSIKTGSAIFIELRPFFYALTLPTGTNSIASSFVYFNQKGNAKHSNHLQ